MGTRIGLATCRELPGGDPDDHELPGLLGAEWVVWDDPDVAWDRYDRVVLRSTWDYQERRDAFLAWCDRVGPERLRNDPATVRWNTDKRYLVELGEAGLPVVPTTLGATFPTDGSEYVVKPTVSAGSRDTARFTGEDARAHELARRIEASGRTVMVQPYVPSVDERGETALLFFAGTFSHAIRKAPILKRGQDPTSELFAAEEIAPREATAAERAVADAVLRHVSRERDLLYARIDLVEAEDGSPLLLELELTEPSLFFAHAPGSAERFASAVRANLL